MGKISFYSGTGPTSPLFTTLVNRSSTQVDPATDQKLDEIYVVNQQIKDELTNQTDQKLDDIYAADREVRDELSQPNEDILVPDTPAAGTDYAVTVDMARGLSFVGALYSDVAPDSVKVEGSVDSTNFYEMDGIDIDVSTWNTSKFNVYKIEPYMRYMRFVLHTGSSAPSKVMMIARGVRQ